jgi:hypothetical protein
VDLSTVAMRFGLKVANKFTVAAIFEVAIEAGCSAQNVIAGFKKCGLFPFDINWCSTK